MTTEPHVTEAFRAAHDALPALPWTVGVDDPTRVLDATGAPVLTAASPDVAASIIALVALAPPMLRYAQALRALADGPAPAKPPRLVSSQWYSTLDEVAAFLPEGAGPPPLPMFGAALTLWIVEQRKRLADPAAWEAREAANRAATAEAESNRVAAEKSAEREHWVERAVARGCVIHRPTMDSVMHPSDTFALRTTRGAIKWYMDRVDGPLAHGVILVLSGSNGAGKTVAATYVVASRKGAVGVARFVTAEVIAGLPDSDWSEYLKAKDALASVPFLVIDECGAELAKAAGLRVSSILRRRYDNGKFTIVTTNLTREQFCERYYCTRNAEGKNVPDLRFVSRLDREQLAAGLNPWVDVPVEDHRGEHPTPAAPSFAHVTATVAPQRTHFTPTRVRGR